MPETGGVCGRRRELGVMAAFLDGLRSGPSGLLLEGEAGIGKTTVWRAGVADVAAAEPPAGCGWSLRFPDWRADPIAGCFG